MFMINKRLVFSPFKHTTKRWKKHILFYPYVIQEKKTKFQKISMKNENLLPSSKGGQQTHILQ